jgi:RNA polymerase sigma-70 factor (ECF subfamily)
MNQPSAGVKRTVPEARVDGRADATHGVRPLDAESRAWLTELTPGSRDRDAALTRLHELLLRAAGFEARRRRAALTELGEGQLADLIQQAADDALVAVLAKLNTFRGESRFTTWAYKFALLEAGVKLRRRAWQDREVQLDSDRWPAHADPRSSPHEDAESDELLRAVRDAVAAELTPHQREVLVAITLDGVPIDVLAGRLGTTRGALYKTLHDARRKLRAALEAQQLELPAPRPSRGTP